MTSDQTPYFETPLAIIGMACRLPGANDLDEYWSLISEGRSAITELPASRLDQSRYYDPEIGRVGTTYSKIGGIVSERTRPPEPFRLTPEEVRNADTSHLELCQVAGQAFRDAGLDPARVRPQNCGVYVGHQRGSTVCSEMSLHAMAGHAMNLLRETSPFSEQPASEQAALIQEITAEVRRDLPQYQPGGGPHHESSEASRLISKAFELDGPFVSINAACSSSLVALTAGAQALQMGDIDMAVIGGASNCKLDALILFSQAHSVSGTGSRPFDASADGLVAAEGFVVVLVKTLSRALADGDRIRAVIRGIGISSDGKGKSLWAPRKEGQIAAIRRAYSSDFQPSSIQYIEAHATSTPVGDSTEVNSLAAVFGESANVDRKIPIGSVKANIGHTLESAGLAGLIKTVLAMEHQVIPPVTHVQQPNPNIDWESTPFVLPPTSAPWPAPGPSQPRRAAVNAFGIGGLNVHVAMESYEPGTQVSASSPQRSANEDRCVAIVGTGILSPGAPTMEAFWNLLRDGTDPKVPIPTDRWDIAVDYSSTSVSDADSHAESIATATNANSLPGVTMDVAGLPNATTETSSSTAASRNSECLPDTDASAWVGGFMQDFSYDWRKHRVPPKQIAKADPLQFMILDTVEQALQNASYHAKLDREHTAVIVANVVGGEYSAQLHVGLRLPALRHAIETILRDRGKSEHLIDEVSRNFADVLLERMPAMLDETGGFSNSSLATRITKTYDLMGGAFSIDSGDNSSAMAVDLARRLLLRGDCKAVIVAAGQRALGPHDFEKLRRAGRLSPTGHVRALDATSDGMAPAEGVAVVLLKRRDDALQDGDAIQGVIRAIGVSRTDDRRTAQETAMQRALAGAGLNPGQLSAVEMAACGVPDEDRCELEAIANVYASHRKSPLHISSLAGQIGHAGGAAGLMSLVKSSLTLQHMESPLGLAARQPLTVATSAPGAEDWCTLPDSNQTLPVLDPTGLVFSAIHSFFKGLSCHVILERGQPVSPPKISTQPRQETVAANSMGYQQCLLEADSTNALVVAAERLASHRDADVTRRSAETAAGATARYALAIVYRTHEELREKAQRFVALHDHAQRKSLLEGQGIYQIDREPRPLVAFMFPGQGSQYPGMLKTLVQEHPVASAAQERIDATLLSLSFPSFASLVDDPDKQLGRDVWRTQLSVLVANCILYEVVSAMGLSPDRISAHSYGEFAALVASGVWDFRTAAMATYRRCQLIANSPQLEGTMMACELDHRDAQRYCDGYTGAFVANCNSDQQTVVAGTTRAIHDLYLQLQKDGIQAKRLPVPRPYHTPLMAPVQDSFRDQLYELPLSPPHAPVLSSVHQRYVAEPDDIRELLVNQLVDPVLYPTQIKRLADEGVRVFVEVGPGQVLTRLHQRMVEPDCLALATDHKQRPYQELLARYQAALTAAGRLHTTSNEIPSTSLPSRLTVRTSTKSKQTSALKPASGNGSHPRVAAPSVRVTASRGEDPNRTTASPPLLRQAPAPQPLSTPAPPGGLQILTLAGSPEAMGVTHGQVMAAPIRRMLDRYPQIASGQLGRGLPDLTEAKSQAHRLLDPDALAELHALAGAVGVSADALLDHNLFGHPDIGAGCIQILTPFLSTSASSKNQTQQDKSPWLHAANEDMPLGLYLRDTMQRCVQVRKPTGKRAHLLFSTAGHVAGINGVNAAGVVVTSSMLLDTPRRPETLDGWLHSILVRRILESASSVREALDLLQQNKATGGWGICLSDAIGSTPAYVEYDGQNLQVKHLAQHHLVSNHALLLSPTAPTPSHSERRLQRLESLFREQTPSQVDLATLQRWLRDQFDEARQRVVRFPTMNTLRRVDNQLSVIFDVEGSQCVWATAGPHVATDEADQFYELDLKQLLDLEPPGAPLHTSSPAPHQQPYQSTPATRSTQPASSVSLTTATTTTAAPDLSPSAGCSEPAPQRVLSWAEFSQAASNRADASDNGQAKGVCERFVLRCVPAPPVPKANIAKAFSGGAVVVGNNDVAQRMAVMLRSGGARCLHLRELDETEHALSELELFCQSGIPTNLFLLTAFDASTNAPVQQQACQSRRSPGMLVPYFVCQRWMTKLLENDLAGEARCLAGVRLGGLFGFDDQVDSPEGGFSTGLIKGLFIEQGIAARSDFAARVVDFDSGLDADFVAARMIEEAACIDRRMPEIAYRHGTRHVVSPIRQPVEPLPRRQVETGSVWVITGGARGVTAKLAKAIGERFNGRLHLIGSSPLPDIDPAWRERDPRELRAEVVKSALQRGEVPIQAWSRVEKALEMDRNLRDFADAGIQAQYHACDVSDHPSLAKVLERIRRQEGRIDGIVHGAGYEKAASFPKKQPEHVARTIASKVDGALSLMELTWHDDLKYFVAFASIAGRFGGVGQTDYCIANELLCKLVAWFRQRRPQVHSVAFDWPSWDEVGMAVRPESRVAKKLVNMQFMPVAEGVRHCLEELQRGCPEGEVLITDWDRYKRFYSDALIASLRPTNHPTARISTNDAMPVVSQDVNAFPLIDDVRAIQVDQAYGVLASHLADPVKDDYLAQHLLRGRPIFPFVAATEACVEAASLLGLSPGPMTIENLRIAESLRFFTDQPQEIRVRAVRADDQIHCALLSDFRNRKGVVLRKDRVHAECTLSLEPPRVEVESVRAPEAGAEYFPMMYLDHKLAVYHGPLYRQVKSFHYRLEASWAKIRVPDPCAFFGAERNSRVFLPCVLIDACVFCAGVHEWTVERTAIALPRSIERLSVLAMPVVGEQVMARVTPVESTGDSATFHIDVWDLRGQPLLQMRNYRADVLVATIPLHRTPTRS